MIRALVLGFLLSACGDEPKKIVDDAEVLPTVNFQAPTDMLPYGN